MLSDVTFGIDLLSEVNKLLAVSCLVECAVEKQERFKRFLYQGIGSEVIYLSLYLRVNLLSCVFFDNIHKNSCEGL